MQGPEHSHSSQASHGSSAQGGKSSRPLVTIIGAVVLVAGTFAAIVQPPRAEPMRESSVTSLDWWVQPVERNAILRLPVSKGPLNAVFALRGTDEVWFAGNGGLVIHSTNAGRTWQSTNLVATPQVVRVRPSAKTALGKEQVPRLRSGRQSAAVRTRPGTTPVSLVSATQAQAQQQYQQQTRTPRTVVPRVGGMGYAAAVAILRKANLRAEEVPFDGPTRMLQGYVVRQSPAAGDSVAINSVVRVYVAGGSSAVPNGPVDSAIQSRADSAAPLAGSDFYPDLSAICFTSAGTGWTVGNRGAVFRSTDHGATWTQVPTDTQAELNDIACNATMGAVVVGEVVLLVRPDAAKAEIRTTASRRRSVTILRGGTLTAIDVIAGAEGGVFTSADTGRTWQSDPGLAGRSAGPIAFADALNGVAMEMGLGMDVTTDGGRTWQRATGCTFGAVTGAPRVGLRELVASSPDIAIVLDAHDRLWKTTDRWNTCTPLGAFHPFTVRLAAASNDRWYAAADGGFRSDDGGRTWQSLIHVARLSSLQFRDSLHGLAGLENGLVATTSNAGRSWSYARLDSMDSAAPVHIASRTERDIFVTTDVARFRSTDGGASWSSAQSADSVAPIFYVDQQTAWGIGGDSLYVTRDGGQTWTRANPTGILGGLNQARDLDVRGMSFLRDRNGVAQIWVTSANGTLVRYAGTKWDTLATALIAASPVTPTLAYGLDTLGNLIRSVDGGRQWTPAPVNGPRKYPAPWYYGFAAITVGATLATSRARRRKEDDVEDSIADILVSDRPLREGDRDVLEFGRIAAGLSRFIRNSRTEPPLTIAITGPWGTGKSSLMNLLRRDLERRGFRTIWFNAWHHQREESLLASLLESIRLTATPPVWTPKGVRFRFRLLGKRIARYAVPALALLPVFALAMGYILKDPAKRWHDLDAVFSSFVNLFSSSEGASTAKVAADSTAAARGSTGVSQNKTIIALIISIVGTVLTYLKGLRAFGVKPDEVARSVVSAGRVKTIQTQPAFRYRFAQDFSEVTEALKPERIVIFVDDLDRCKPEQVLEILEAINFLSESGDCVVVLGIDRERVTGCVAIGFKEVATVLSETRDKPAAAIKLDIGAIPAARKTDIEYQIEYAEHYLEKLLNMEIPIPPATPQGLGDVMTNTASARDDDDVSSVVDDGGESRERHRRRARRYLYTVVAAALTIGMFLAGWNGSAWVERMTQPDVAPVAIVAAKDVAVNTDTAATVAPKDTVRRDTATTSIGVNPIPLVQGTPPTTAWWLHGVLALAALGVLFWLITPREDNRVEDSAAFAAALRAWAPVLFEQHRTPRSAKKFLNKMRFLSMAQRGPAERQAPVEQAIAKLGDIPWLRKFLSAFERAPQTQEVLLPGSIPEVALVSLNVIRDRQPEWLDDPDFWTSDLRKYVEARLKPVPKDIEDALDALSRIATPDGGALQNFRWCQAPWERLEVWIRDS
ncbi:MAG: P-loop NTPase fold protein [bacterium]